MKYFWLMCTRCNLNSNTLAPQQRGTDPAYPATVRIERDGDDLRTYVIPHKPDCVMLDKAREGRI